MTPTEELETELGFRVGMDDVYYATDGISYTKVRKPRGFEPELWTALLAAKQRIKELELRATYQCVKCGQIRHAKHEPCICGAIEVDFPRDIFRRMARSK